MSVSIATPQQRTPEDFVAWLKGFVDGIKDKPDAPQWQTLKFNLAGCAPKPWRIRDHETGPD